MFSRVLRFGPAVLAVIASLIVGPLGVAGARPAHRSASAPLAVLVGMPDGRAVTWAHVADGGLHLTPDAVSCPSTTLCVFTGGTPSVSAPGTFGLGVSGSTGSFRPAGKLTGHLTRLAGWAGFSYVSCPSTRLCVLSSGHDLYATRSPITGPWVLELTVSDQEVLGAVSCPDVTFCAVATGAGDVLISTAPLGGAGTWARTDLSEGSASLQAISCPSAHLCVAGGVYLDGLSGWVDTSTDPRGGPSAWSGGVLAHPGLAEGPDQYAVTGVSCPTTAFCVLEAGELQISTVPAAGPSDWRQFPLGDGISGIAWCRPGGSCTESDVGSFRSAAASGPGVAGVPEPEVSCASPSFCVSVETPPSDLYVHVEVGGITGGSPRPRV